MRMLFLNLVKGIGDGLSELFKTRYRVCSTFGIPIYLSLPFLIFVGMLGSQYYNQGHLEYLIFTYVIYKCVVLHELGHSLTAKIFGYSVDDITLYPLMGIAKIDVPWDYPRAEFWIGLSGPLVSLTLAYLTLPLIHLFPENEYIFYFCIVNTMLFLFNMLPICPMDGGRILRASLGVFLTPFKASNVTFIISSIAFPIVLLLFGYYLGAYQIFLLAPFIYAMAALEYISISRENFHICWRIHEAEKALFKSGIKCDPIYYAGYLEFLELSTKIVMDLFIPLKATREELIELIKKTAPNELFVENGEYKLSHPDFQLFERYWSSPSSMRKYIVADIVTDVLHDEYEFFLKKAKDVSVENV